jgi:hypothetical protein
MFDKIHKFSIKAVIICVISLATFAINCHYPSPILTSLFGGCVSALFTTFLNNE